MENTEMLNIRISAELKQTLEKQAQQKSQTVSDYVRELLARHVLQDGDYISSISPELMEKITAEAQRRKQSEANVIARALRYAFAHHKDGGWWRW